MRRTIFILVATLPFLGSGHAWALCPDLPEAPPGGESLAGNGAPSSGKAAESMSSSACAYIIDQPTPDIKIDGVVEVGQLLPDSVELHVIPGTNQYEFANVNNLRVLVDPGTREVVQIFSPRGTSLTQPEQSDQNVSQEAPVSSSVKSQTDAARWAPLIEVLPTASENPAPTVHTFQEGQARGQILSSDFIGRKVYDVGSAQVGTITDIMFEVGEATTHIILEVTSGVDEGLSPRSEKRLAFPLSDLRFMAGEQENRVVIALDRAAVDAAPQFTSLADEMAMNDGQSLTKEESESDTDKIP